MFRSVSHALFVLVAATSLGCSSSEPPPVTATSEPADSNAVQNAQPAAVEPQNVTLDILTYDQMQQRLADKRGKVVVMDAWSTACPPCMKDFHNLVELHNQYPGEELACVSLSFDYEGLGEPEEVREPVLGFLRSQGAAFDNWMSSEESDVLYRKLDLNAVPAIFVYDRQGKLRQRFESEGAYPQVRELVAELVQEPMPADEDGEKEELEPPRHKDTKDEDKEQ